MESLKFVECSNDLVRTSTKVVQAAAEKLVLDANDTRMSTCALRPSVLFGEGDYQLIPSIYTCIIKGEMPYVVGNGDNLWDVTYAGNVADAHVLAVENLLSTKTAAGEAIFISNEEPIPFRDFCLATWASFGYYPSYTFQIPVAIASFAGLIAEWVTWISGSSTTLSQGSVLDACATRYCSGAKARKLLGYKPRVGIEEGLRMSCAVRNAGIAYYRLCEADFSQDYARRLKMRANSESKSRFYRLFYSNHKVHSEPGRKSYVERNLLQSSSP